MPPDSEMENLLEIAMKTPPLPLFLAVAVAAAAFAAGCVKTDVAAVPAVPAAAEPAETPSYMEIVCANVRPVLPGVLYAGTPTDLELLDEKAPWLSTAE